ncbi:UbiA-domain-containing protein [Xylariaceae sp. AK1471]|nr:UbiA-domain-containing protein [Xylariaceae sp. AK1471]
MKDIPLTCGLQDSIAKDEVNAAQEEKPNTMPQQYSGGVDAQGWVSLLPAWCVPWVQLCRLYPPAALFLVYFPNLFGVLHAATAQSSATPIAEVVYACGVLFVASFFGSNAAHAWNDLVDAPLDAQVARTRDRPIPRGAVSPRAAALFAVSQVVCLLGTLRLFLPFPQAQTATAAAVPVVLGTAYYPFAKRHSNLPQMVLGFCLTWAIMVGSSAVGDAARRPPWTDPSTLALLFAAVLWVVLFDTIYAHQDVTDDVRVGIGSTAVLLLRLRDSRAGAVASRLPLWALLGGMIAGLAASGHLAGMGFAYYVLAVGGSALSVGAMVANVDLGDPANCWLWFSQGFWATGLAIAAGLVVEYARQSGTFAWEQYYEQLGLPCLDKYLVEPLAWFIELRRA